MNWREQLLKAFTDRWLNIGVCSGLSVLFGVGVFFADTWWGAVMMAWASGAQFGFAAMWFVGPAITNTWRRQMEAEIAIMTAAVFARIMRESNIQIEMGAGPPPSPPISPLH